MEGILLNNMMMLRQARNGIRVQIDTAPDSITITRPTQVSDGFGGLMPGTGSTALTAKVRISHRYGTVQELVTSPNGLDTGFGLFLLTDHNTIPAEDDIFIARNRAWRVGPVNALIKFGGVIAYEAPLTQGSILITEENGVYFQGQQLYYQGEPITWLN